MLQANNMRVKRVDLPECTFKYPAFTLALLREHKDKIKANANIDVVGKTDHQKSDVYLDDGVQDRGARDVIFELSNLKSDFGISAPQKKGDKNDKNDKGDKANNEEEITNDDGKSGESESNNFSIGFPQLKNGPELTEFTNIIDEIIIREGVRNSVSWFDGEVLEMRDVKNKYNPVLKKPKKKENLEKFGRAFKVVIEPTKLKRTDVFINGVPSSFQELFNLSKQYKDEFRVKELTWTLRFKFQKVWFGENKAVNGRFVLTRICCFENNDDNDDSGFTSISVQLPGAASQTPANTPTVNAQQSDKQVSQEMILQEAFGHAGQKRSAPEDNNSFTETDNNAELGSNKRIRVSE